MKSGKTLLVESRFAEKTSGQSTHREQTISSIIRLVHQADDEKLSNIYNFVLHIIN